MSAKYRRIKQQDEALPAPLRWLTRAFSSITLAVILLSLVFLYGVLGSVPLPMLLGGALSLLTILSLVGIAISVWRGFLRRLGATARLIYVLVVLAATAAWGWFAVPKAYTAVSESEWGIAERATVLYRVRGIEMTELEFYSAWPMQLLLGLFVVNMIWATIRRIAFTLPNLGVLTVHTGIVTMSLGAIFYGMLKVEGDVLLPRMDLVSQGAAYSQSFYDRNDPAIYLSVNGQFPTMLPLKGLPRYHDYRAGSLELPLHEQDAFRSRYDPRLRVTIESFHAYAVMVDRWRDATHSTDPQTPSLGEAIQFGFAPRDQDPALIPPAGILVAGVPAQRVYHADALSMEFLKGISPERLTALSTSMPAPHVLLLDFPELGYRETLAIQTGLNHPLGETGLTMEVEEVGPYNLPFMSVGYEGATDTMTRVRISGTTADGADVDFRRIVMHRYPERSQDFLPTNEPEAGPMGQRRDPNPAFKLTYLDNTLTQLHFVVGHLPDEPETMGLLLRSRGAATWLERFEADKLPLGSIEAGAVWLHFLDRIGQAVREQVPMTVPRERRDPKSEGTYEHAILGVRVQMLNTATGGLGYDETVYLGHLLYPDAPGTGGPIGRVEVPGLGTLELVFSREQHRLPFLLALRDFEMVPYPGSDQPRDFVATLEVIHPDEEHGGIGRPTTLTASMNNPVKVTSDEAPLGLGTLKLSQNSWDPGDPQAPPSIKQAINEEGRLINQQRFSIVGVANNVGIRVIALGCAMIMAGIPWAFYVKPWMVKRKARAAVKRAKASRVEPEAAEPLDDADPKLESEPEPQAVHP